MLVYTININIDIRTTYVLLDCTQRDCIYMLKVYLYVAYLTLMTG